MDSFKAESTNVSQHPEASDPMAASITALVDTLMADANASGVWDEIRERAESPDFAAALADALRRRVGSDGTESPGFVTRALRFHEEWFGDGSEELSAFLEALVELDTQGNWWAFERLSVLYTSRERWPKLLRLYDLVLESSVAATQRVQALEEAAQCARDFAGEPEKAIRYFEALIELEPQVLRRYHSLERLLEKTGDAAKLSELLAKRAEREEGAELVATRLQLAQVQREGLHDAQAAVATLETTWAQGAVPEAALSLRSLLEDDSLSAESRGAAFEVLSAGFSQQGDRASLREILETALSFAEDASQRANRLGRLAQLTDVMGDRPACVAFSAAWVEAAPRDVDARTLLAHVAEDAEGLALRAQALEAAAQSLLDDDIELAATLQVDAAELQLGELEQPAAGTALYEALWQRVQGLSDWAPRIARRLAEVYAETEQAERELEALERVAAVAPASQKREALWQLVRRAQAQADVLRVVSALREMVAADARDWEALDALVEALRDAERWSELVEALRMRVQADVPDWQRRLDLMDMADVQSTQLDDAQQAISTWEEVATRFQRDERVVKSLASLYGQTGAWEAVEQLLTPHVAGARERLIDALLELAELRRVHLGQSEMALGDVLTVLALEPLHADALELLTELAKEPALREGALLALERAALRKGDEAQLLSLTNDLVALEQPVEEAISRLLRAVALCDAAQGEQALAFAQKALALQPHRGDLAEGVVSLAERYALHGIAAAGLTELAGDDGLTTHARVSLWLQVRGLCAEAPTEAQDALAEAALLHIDAAVHRHLEALLSESELSDALVSALRQLLERQLPVETRRVTLALLRRHPDRAYLEGLLELAGMLADPLAVLSEALGASSEPYADEALRRAIVVAYFEALCAAKDLDDQVRLGELQRCRTVLGELELEPARYLALLELGLRHLPEPRAAEWWQDVARCAAEQLADPERAAFALQQAYSLEASAELATQLAPLLESQGRLTELLSLRYAELERESDSGGDPRLPRLELAQLLGRIESEARVVSLLRDNLQAQPGDPESVEALAAYFERRGDVDALTEHLAQQAAVCERLEATDRAVELWSRAAQVHRQRRRDLAATIACLRAAVRLSPESVDMLATLADCELESGDDAAAITTLGRLIAKLQGASRRHRYETLLELLKRHGQERRFTNVLEEAFNAFPEHTPFRDALLAHYRDADDVDGLVATLSAALPHVSTREAVLAYVREAVEILEVQLDRMQDALPMLARALEIDPTNRELLRAQARALLAAGHFDEARSVLEGLIDDFGQRRNAERGALHAQLAAVLVGQAQHAEAITHLQAAVEIDASNLSYLQQLGEVARLHGDLEAAERAYRTLLLVVRRQKDSVDANGPSMAQVLFALARVARARGDEAKADELLSSASDNAANSAGDAIAFAQVLSEEGSYAEAEHILQRRLERAEETLERQRLFSALGDVLEHMEDKSSAAYEARMEALRLLPTDSDALQAASQTAQLAGLTEAFVDSLQGLARGLRRRSDAPVVARMHAHASTLYDLVLQQAEPAREACMEAARVEGAPVDVFVDLAEFAERHGDHALERRWLDRVLELEPSAEMRARTLYRVADLNADNPMAAEVALAQVAEAYALDPQPELLGRNLSKLLRDPNLSDALVAELERMVRESADDRLLLAFIEARSLQQGGNVEVLREGIEVAQRLGELVVGERLITTLLELENAVPASLQRWAQQARVRIYQDTDRLREALVAQEALIPLLPEGEKPAERRRLALLAASLPEAEDRAVELLSEVLEETPEDLELWSAWLALPASVAAPMSFAERIVEACGRIDELSIRNALRLRFAEALKADARSVELQVSLLRDGLADAPGDAELTTTLSQVFEANGFDQELIDVLESELGSARESGQADAVATIATRLVEAQRRFQPERAEALLASLEREFPLTEALLEAKLALLELRHAERAECLEVREQLLAFATGATAATAALALATQWRECEREDRVEAVLHRALEAAPGDATLLAELERLFTESERWAALKSLWVSQADALPEHTQALKWLKQAAALALGQLDDEHEALALQQRALELDPSDVNLLCEYLHTRSESGDAEGAFAALEARLEHFELGASETLPLRATRAALAQSLGRFELAIEDFEALSEADYPNAFEGLVQALQLAVAQAVEAGTPSWSQVVRLFECLSARQDTEEAWGVVECYLAACPDDLDAWRFVERTARAADDSPWQLRALEARARLEASPEERVEVTLAYCAALSAQGDLQAAVAPIEAALEVVPDARLRSQLMALYEELGQHEGLARLLQEDLEGIDDPEARRAQLLRLAELYTRDLGDSARALPCVEEAAKLDPSDIEVTTQLVRTYLAASRAADARAQLEAQIEALGKRRGATLSALNALLAEVARAEGDQEAELQWLGAALEADKQNGEAAATLAELAMSLGQFDTALQALRAVTLLRSDCSMSRGRAFYLQARIAHENGEQRRALLWARKAVSEDAESEEAAAFLAELGG